MCIVNKTCDNSLCNARIAMQIKSQNLLINESENSINSDALAISTIYTKICLNKLNNTLDLFKKSILFK